MSSRSGGGLKGLLYAAEKQEVLGSPGATSRFHDHTLHEAEKSTSAGASGSNTTLASRKRPRARADSEGVKSTPENGRDDSDNSNSAAASPKVCEYDTCTKPARSGGRKFCRRHGEGRRCKTPGCNKVDVGGGSCRKHGGGRRCVAEGCMKTDVGGGYCVSHGGGRRCQAEGCAKGAQAGGVFCKSHGGGRRCRIEGCMTSAQSGADVLCIKHGGGKRCTVPGCQKLVRKNNRCTKHASEDSTTTSPPPTAAAAAATSRATPVVSVSASTAAKTAKARAAVAATSAALAETRTRTTTTTTTTRASPAPPAPAPRRRPAPSPGIELPGQSPSPTDHQAPQHPPPERRETRAVPPGRPFHHKAFPDSSISSSSSSTQHSKPPALPPQPLPDGDSNGRGGYASGGGGGSYPTMTSRGPPSPCFGPNPGFSFRGSLSAFHPPLAAFSGRVAPTGGVGGELLQQDGSTRGTLGGLHDDVASSSSGYSPPPSFAPDQGPRFRDRLPGIESLRSLSLDRRIGPGEGNNPLARSMDQVQPPNYSAASHLLSLGGSVPRDLPPTGPMAPTSGIGGSSDSLAMLGPGGLGSSSAQRLRAAQHCPPPPYHRGNRFSDGAMERSPSLSPLPASLLLQPPPPPSSFPTPCLPGDPQSATGNSGGVPPDTPGVSTSSSPAGRGPTPVMSQAGPSASERSTIKTTAAISFPYTCRPSSFASVAASDGWSAPCAGEQGSSRSNGTCSSGGERRSPSEPAAAAAARSPEMAPSAAAVAPPRKASSCCGGNKSGAVRGTGTAPAMNGNGSNRARSCSTSPPAEQTSSYISLSIKSMRCIENCGQTIQQALQAVPGVRSVTIHFPTKTASVHVDPEKKVSVEHLTSALDAVGFGSECFATSTTEEPALQQDGVNAVWAIANALGLVDPGCAMAWGAPCSCGDDCQCINCPQHMKKVSHAVDLVLKAVDLSSATDPDSTPEKPQQEQQQQQQQQQQQVEQPPHQKEQDLAA